MHISEKSQHICTVDLVQYAFMINLSNTIVEICIGISYIVFALLLRQIININYCVQERFKSLSIFLLSQRRPFSSLKCYSKKVENKVI